MEIAAAGGVVSGATRPLVYRSSVIGRRLKLRFTLEVQRSGQGLCPTLLRLPGPLGVSPARHSPATPPKPAATGVATRKRAGMRIDPADLAESIGTLADLDPDRGLTRGLDRVVAAATALFGADTAGLMLLANDGTLAAASAFDQQGELAELAQAQLGHGPCMEAFTRGLPVAIPDLRTDPRFDRIAFVLRSAGIRGALCVPVEVLGGPIGTLDLFTAIPRAWDDSEVSAAHAYAGVVASLLG